MPIFLRLCLVSACSGFDCRFTHIEPSVRRKGVDLRPNQVKRARKRRPIGTRRLIQGTNHSPRQTIKQHVWETGSRRARGHHGSWWLPQSDCGGCQDQYPPSASVSSQLFVFPHDFSSVRAAILPLKRMNLAVKRGRLHSFSTSLTQSNSIGEIGRRRINIKRKQRHGGKIKRSLL